MKIITISGGFDPIHSGHLEYIKSAKSLGNKLIVCLNSDNWLVKKKGKYFLPFEERKFILESLKDVDEVISFEDDKLGSCINGLLKIKDLYPNDEIIFCNGGDRDSSNIPEMSVKGIIFEFGVGGCSKKNSSSWILKNWAYPREERVWGMYYDLFKDKNVKVKELIVSPKSGMSYQRHLKRSEIWLVSEGMCEVFFSHKDADKKESIVLHKFDHFVVPVNSWHQITNPFEGACKLIEIQFGEETIEEDIERLSYYNSPLE